MIRREEPNKNPDPAGTGLEPAGDGQMWVAPHQRSNLHRAGLGQFDAVMGHHAGHCLRALADRENWHLRLDGAHEPAVNDQPAAQSQPGVYLKKHHVRTLWSWLRARLGFGPGETAGRVEARNVSRLSADGIEVMRLVAYGERLDADGMLQSFVLTEELTGYMQLDHFLLERFPMLHHQPERPRDPDLNRLIRQVAAIAGRFHRAGYNHRDLYCCHFFVKELPRGRFDIKLIDLQRVQHRRRFRRRWLVKDLAQLAYSAPRTRIKCTQKFAFMRAYLGVDKLRPRDKRLIRRVLAKQHLMERNQGIIP